MPQFRVFNESSNRLFLSNLFINPDAHFSINGIMQVEIDSRIVSMAGAAGDLRLKQTQSVQIINEILEPYEALNVYIWNGNNEDEIQATLSVATSLVEFTSDTADQARSELDLQAEVSETPGISMEGQALLNEIGGVIAAIGNQSITVDNQNVIDALTDLQNALPDSPNNAALETLLQSVIDGLPDSPDNADLLERLSQVITAINEQEINLDTSDLEAAINALNNDLGLTAALNCPIDRSTLSSNQTQALDRITTALNGLLDGFDLYELENSITVLRADLPTINADISSEAREKFRVLLFQLERTQETIPTVQTTNRGTILPFQKYEQNTQHTVLINTRGRTNLIIEIPEAPILAPVIYSNTLPDFSRLVSNFNGVSFTERVRWDMINHLGTQRMRLEFILGGLGTQTPQNSGLRLRIRIRVSDDANFNTYTQIFNGFAFAMAGAGVIFPHIRYDPVFTEQPNFRYLQVELDLQRTSFVQGNPFISEVRLSPLNRSTGDILPQFWRSGGEVHLDLQILNSFNQWADLYLGSETGAFSDGFSPKTITISRADGFVLPSTQTALRALIRITGQMETGISLVYV